MTTIRDIDEHRAQEFYASRGAISRVEKFAEEMDDEIRECLVKTAMYVVYRESGMDPVFAGMNACRRAPGASNTDRNFNEHARHRMNGMSGKTLDKMLQIAHRAGINTTGKYYVGGLGRYNDPAAWVSTADDILSVARSRNMTVTGAVKHKGHDVPPPTPKPLAADIVKRQVQGILSREPQTREKVQKKPSAINEVKERVIANHQRKRRYARG